MGLPIIGTDVFNIYNFLGFAGTNFLLHEMSKWIINEDFWTIAAWRAGKLISKDDSALADTLKERFESLLIWDKALGVKFIFDKDTIVQISAYVDWKGKLQVIESPHHRGAENPKAAPVIFESIERFQESDGERVVVKLKEELYRDKEILNTKNIELPKDKQYRHIKPKIKKHFKKHLGIIEFYLPNEMKSSKEIPLGERIKVDLKDMGVFAETIHINNNGKKKFLFNKNYGTKLFFENGGFSQITSPFEALRNSATVFAATPIAFSMGKVLETLYNDHVLTFAPMLEAPIGLYAMFIVGGMYGLAASSTIYEFIAHSTWEYANKGMSFLDAKIPDRFAPILPKFLKEIDNNGKAHFTTSRVQNKCQSFFEARSSELAKYNPNMNIDDFGKIMQGSSKGYTYGRLYTGLIMGGALTLAFRNQFGDQLDKYIKGVIDPNEQDSEDFIDYNYGNKTFDPVPEDYKHKFMPDIKEIQKQYIKEVSEARDMETLSNSFKEYLTKIGLKDHQKGLEEAFDAKVIPGFNDKLENRRKHIVSFVETNALDFSFDEHFGAKGETYE